MRHGTLLLCGWILLAWSFSTGPTPLWAARQDQIEKDLSQKRKDLKEIRKELTTTREKEKKIQKRESSILESLHQIETELYQKEKELKQMESQLNQTKSRLQQARQQLHALNQGMDRTRGELSSRIVALYKMGRRPPEEFLLTSESYLDRLKMDKYLRVVIDSDARLVNTYRSQLLLKEKYRDELTEDQLQWQRRFSEVERKKAEITKARRAKQALLRSIQSEKAITRKLISELEGRATKLQTLVEKLEREKSLLAYKPVKPDSSKGKLLPPVHGSMVSQFKERGQNGIEIRAPMDADVRAILPGKVLYADWFKGFGNMLIIDHGDHTFTVSAYCSQLLKKEGDTVAQGETIARVGSAGSLKGPCLYFEIRHRGKPQDPMEWILNPEKMLSVQEEPKSGKK
ncbi:MAG: murein hydrolase activator EnvC family protein [Thermodesulfobacteriota bacterium]